jgi:hypothetical protein
LRSWKKACTGLSSKRQPSFDWWRKAAKKDDLVKLVKFAKALGSSHKEIDEILSIISKRKPKPTADESSDSATAGSQSQQGKAEEGYIRTPC